MNATILLRWQYLIYLLPLGVSTLLLLLSSLRFGHRGAHGASAHASAHAHGLAGAHGVSGAHGHNGGGQHVPAPMRHATAHGPAVHARLGKVEVNRHGPNRENVTVTANLLLQITGADRAPLAMLLEVFALIWGVCGYWANQYTLHSAAPSFREMAPSLGIALGGGIIGTRIGAEIIARLLPADESADVSREGLFGLTGKVAFPVSDSGGRILIYDDHGTLHDEVCRLAPGHEPIAKNRTAMVMDMDPQGRLIVEEVPERIL